MCIVSQNEIMLAIALMLATFIRYIVLFHKWSLPMLRLNLRIIRNPDLTKKKKEIDPNVLKVSYLFTLHPVQMFPFFQYNCSLHHNSHIVDKMASSVHQWHYIASFWQYNLHTFQFCQ